MSGITDPPGEVTEDEEYLSHVQVSTRANKPFTEIRSEFAHEEIRERDFAREAGRRYIADLVKPEQYVLGGLDEMIISSPYSGKARLWQPLAFDRIEKELHHKTNRNRKQEERQKRHKEEPARQAGHEKTLEFRYHLKQECEVVKQEEDRE